MSNEKENLVETTEEVNAVEEAVETKTVIKENALDTFPIGTTVYIPYLSVADNIYEVRECVVESIGDIIENNVITIFYKCNVSNTDKVDGETMTLNILANISTSYDDAEKELNEFLRNQIVALEEHSKTISVQLEKNAEHIKMFKEKTDEKK